MKAIGTARAKVRPLRTLAIDIGGSDIKGMVLDELGKPVSEHVRIKTPKPATPVSVLQTICEIAAQLATFDRISVGFPGVVRNGVTETAPNLDPSWAGVQLAREMSQRLLKPVRVANDADIQGYGAIQGRGVELVITLGTGLGSALFLNGKLVPNLEAAHHSFHKGKTYEECLGIRAFEKSGPKRWNKSLRLAIRELEKMFNYDCLFIGGGNARKISGELPLNTKVVNNVAGLLGGIALWRDPNTSE